MSNENLNLKSNGKMILYQLRIDLTKFSREFLIARKKIPMCEFCDIGLSVPNILTESHKIYNCI
jgi:hypothetical protein